MLVSDFNFDLPAELIAQQPLADRAGSRLFIFIAVMQIRRKTADLKIAGSAISPIYYAPTTCWS